MYTRSGLIKIPPHQIIKFSQAVDFRFILHAFSAEIASNEQNVGSSIPEENLRF